MKYIITALLLAGLMTAYGAYWPSQAAEPSRSGPLPLELIAEGSMQTLVLPSNWAENETFTKVGEATRDVQGRLVIPVEKIREDRLVLQPGVLQDYLLENLASVDHSLILDPPDETHLVLMIDQNDRVEIRAGYFPEGQGPRTAVCQLKEHQFIDGFAMPHFPPKSLRGFLVQADPKTGNAQGNQPFGSGQVEISDTGLLEFRKRFDTEMKSAVLRVAADPYGRLWVWWL
ncbi:MAG: hypothetical protein DWQ01_08815 [Planctomycetota bacterium]|nr:MAG: hypothetical protein DWQ01_08815 [Planctomycetota bacterium]